MRFRSLFTRLLLIPILAMSFGIAGCGGSKSLVSMSSQELFQEGQRLYNKKKYLLAVEAFQSCVYNYPGESVVDSAQYFLALSYFGNSEFEVAQVEFNRLALNYPSSVYFENAIFMRAVSFFEATPDHYGLDQSELETAIKHFENFIIDFPESPVAVDAQKYLLVAQTRLARKYYGGGLVYSRMGAYSAAKIYFQKVIDDYTSTEFGPPATFEYAQMEYKMKAYDEASSQFANFATAFPDNEKVDEALMRAAEAAFKSGEQAFKGGDYALAKEKLETYKTRFPGDDHLDDADKILREISELTTDSEQANDEGT